MKNQAIGLKCAVLRSADLSGASLRLSVLARAGLEFASLVTTDLTDASLRYAWLGALISLGVTPSGTDFLGADHASAWQPIELQAAKSFDQAFNLDSLLRE